MSEHEFHSSLRQEVLIHADAESAFSESWFAEKVSSQLIDTGDIEEFTPCQFKQRGIKVDGYALLEGMGILDLFVVEYRDTEEPETLVSKDLQAIFKRAETFFARCLEPEFLEAIETSHPVYDLIERIRSNQDDISQVRIFVFTNSQLSSRITQLPSQRIDEREWSYQVWDLERLERLFTQGDAEPILVDFEELFGEGLNCLPATGDCGETRSFLAVIPGDWLARIYDKYAGRLLEQNVRTFLQFKAGINKGIRKTILETPELFFSFNNGISATAHGVELGECEDGLRILRITDLQIVNGGQTTASIHYSMRKDGDKAKLDRIKVQMKLTVVDRDRAEALVPDISRFANTQNKIQDSDFFSNHPFHTQMEKVSRRIWAPTAKGAVHQTRWFYERVRGQHASQQLHLTKSGKEAFLGEFPKQQVITKVDLAKHHNTFECLPHLVSLGAQRNFKAFAESVTAAWEKDQREFGDAWFQDMVAKSIIFRTLEIDVQKASWYAQGYRANVVTYGIAYLVQKLKDVGMHLDLKRVWKDQSPSAILRKQLLDICEAVQNRIIIASEQKGVRNVTEWCKKAGCWQDIQTLRVSVPQAMKVECLSTSQVREAGRDARKDQALAIEADHMTKVVELGGEFWQKVLDWAGREDRISPQDMKALSRAATIPRRLPNDWEYARLLEIEEMYRQEVHV